MKNFTLLLAFTLTFLSVHSQIIYHDYGEQGMRVALNENVAWDVDEDGVIDLHINQHENELGFSSVFGVGCLASPDEFAYTEFESRELSIFQKDDVVILTNSNLYDYIDTDRGSIYEDNGGEYAIGWEDGISQYVGFAILQGFDSVKDAWMRIAVDESTKELVIYELGYNEIGQSISLNTGIIVGDNGISSVNNYVDNLSELSLSPNPASDVVNVSFEYFGNEPLDLNVVDLYGREIYRHQNQVLSGKTDIRLQTNSWSNGTYFLQIRSTKGVEIKKININQQ